MTNDEIYYKSNNWMVVARERNNHPGKKIWILYCDREMYSLDERGFRSRSSGIRMPEDVKQAAKDSWDAL